MEKARSEASKELADLRREMDAVRKELARARQPLEALKTIEEKIEKAEEKVEKPVERNPIPRGQTQKVVVKAGAKGRLRSLNADGIITAVNENDLEVQIGSLRIRAKEEDLLAPTQEEIDPAHAPARNNKSRLPDARAVSSTPFRPSPGMEIDLRGQRADDALDALDRYIANASLAGLPFVRVIHGKGTGRLRQVIREALHANEDVKNFEEGGEKEGGEGVTIVPLE